jgi:type III pantothenate kinase
MLLVDIGNTRVKWATLISSGETTPQRAATYTDWTSDDWQRQLFGTSRFDSLLVSTVAGSSTRQNLEIAAAHSGVDDVRFVASSARAAGVSNAYPYPTLLGVDRWVAVIGAWHLKHGPCCVVDVGTAATLDVVDATGHHLGGLIVPGPALMVRSLHASTSDLATHSAASPSSAAARLADNTRDAIERGCRVALAALVDRTMADLAEQLKAGASLLMTGGAAEEVRPYLRSPAELVPDLVLRGLARLAVEPGA